MLAWLHARRPADVQLQVVASDDPTVLRYTLTLPADLAAAAGLHPALEDTCD